MTVAIQDFNRSSNSEGSFDFSITDTNVKLDDVREQLRTVNDPDIHINIFELGLIYHCDIVDGKCKTVMTLTSPFCPVAGEMPEWVKDALLKVPGINEVDVEMTFEPTFNPDQMSEIARFTLNLGEDEHEDEYVTNTTKFR